MYSVVSQYYAAYDVFCMLKVRIAKRIASVSHEDWPKLILFLYTVHIHGIYVEMDAWSIGIGMLYTSYACV